MILPIYKGP